MLFRWKFFHCNFWSIANWTSPLFFILSHPLTVISFHPFTDTFIPSRSAHKPAIRQSLYRHIYRLDTTYPNIDKHKCTPRTNKASVNQLSVAGEKEIWDLYSQLFWDLCFGLGCLCFVLCVCVVSTSPTGRASIHHIFDLTKCTHSSQPQAEGLLCPYRDQLRNF